MEDDAVIRIETAMGPESGEVLALVEALLAELGEEGQEFAQIDRTRLEQELAAEAASTERGLVGPGGTRAWRAGRFLALLAREESGTAIGVLTLSASFAIYAGGEYGVIDEMYVVPEWRGRGVGTRLVEAAVRVAEERGWFRLDVTGPEGDDATGALRFYRGLGFEPTGEKLRRLV